MTVEIFTWGRRSQGGAARIVVLAREAGRNVRKIESSDLHPSTSRQAIDRALPCNSRAQVLIPSDINRFVTDEGSGFRQELEIGKDYNYG